MVVLDGELIQIELGWRIDVSGSGKLDDDQATVAVIDASMCSFPIVLGCLYFLGSVLLTPFNKVVIPPPLSAAKIKLEKQIDR